MQPTEDEIKDHESGKNDDDNRINIKGLAIKILFVIVIFATAFSLLYYYTQYGKVIFVLAKNEAIPENMESVNTFTVKDKIFFLIKKPDKPLGADLFVLEIGRIKDNTYSNNMQISYELEKDFTHLSAYIPLVYTRRAGVYRIKALLDGKNVAVKDITIVKE